MKLLAKIYLLLLCAGAMLITHAHKDLILEFKAAYFQPTHGTFKHIYHGGALFGPEITFNIVGPIYGFASYDFFTKNGKSLGLSTCTNVRLQVLAAGLKFMHCVADNITLYGGLGFQPIFLHTHNYSPYVIQITHKWGFGGIAKFGMYIDVPCNIVLDLFVDYSLMTVKKSSCNNRPIGYIQQTNANLSGVSFGAGLGYRFN